MQTYIKVGGQTVLFAFVAWMSRYEGPTLSDVPVWGGRRAPNGQARGKRKPKKFFLGESYNFLPLHHRKHGVRLIGDVQSSFDIGGLGGSDGRADGITVVWCAADPRDDGQVKVVGWFRDATVWSDRQEIAKTLRPSDRAQLHSGYTTYNVMARPADSVLLEPDLRPSLPETPGRSKVGRWHSSSKLWKGGGSSSLRAFVKRCLDKDWSSVKPPAVPTPAKPVTRRQILATIRDRQGQEWFRLQLRNAYGDRCAITGCPISSLLDACHIYPAGKVDSEHSLQNGLLLRTDLHTLFDLGKLKIDPETFAVWIDPEITDKAYRRLAQTKLRLVEKGYEGPSAARLRWHWQHAKPPAGI